MDVIFVCLSIDFIGKDFGERKGQLVFAKTKEFVSMELLRLCRFCENYAGFAFQQPTISKYCTNVMISLVTFTINLYIFNIYKLIPPQLSPRIVSCCMKLSLELFVAGVSLNVP